MTAKMPWLKTRLRELNKTPAGLARHLKVHAPRVYEMIGGRRGILPEEIVRMAEFLDWPVEELLKHMPKERRVMPIVSGDPELSSPISVSSYEIRNREAQLSLRLPQCDIPVLGTEACPVNDCDCDAMLSGNTLRRLTAILAGRTDVFAMYLHTTKMKPWKNPGQIVMIEKDRPPDENDHVVVYVMVKDKTTVVVRQLLASTNGAYKLRQHSPGRDITIPRKKVSHMYRVMTLDDCLS